MTRPMAATVCSEAGRRGPRPASTAGDATKGQKIFKKCAARHSLDAGKRKVGPSLHGVIGRTAGTADGYRYSKAM